ncbi:DUF4296 domain-containing protein [Aurantibacter sp.]|uniref:DUF4296 domain-containing protein n=1 Tax=Aurantibacter sp. TaxID=2807103 RepID=UPI003265D3C2
MKRLFFLLVFVLLTSCSEKLIEPPENLLSTNQMVEVLNDLAILNAAKTSNSSILESNGVQAMKFVFEKHGIDSTQFVLSDRYYASRPVEYESIYSKVALMLESEEKRIKELKKVTDSLKKIEKDSIKNLNKLKK